MKLNLKESIKSLKGEALKGEDGEFTVGQALANILSNSKAGGKMKLFILAQKCYKDKEIELDSADLSLIKETVKQSDIYNTLVLGQVELYLEKKDEKKT